MRNKKSIKYWADDDKPREKILQKGSQALSDVELLAILLGSGSANQSAIELSRSILNDVSNNLNLLGKITAKDLITNEVFLFMEANNFNYGFSLLISHYIRNLKLSTGINYSTKYYDSAGSAFYSTEKHKHYLQYLNFFT